MLGKSGIGYAALGGSDYDRRILTTQLVEYAGDGTPVQVLGDKPKAAAKPEAK